jgi:hypothetical protein
MRVVQHGKVFNRSLRRHQLHIDIFARKRSAIALTDLVVGTALGSGRHDDPMGGMLLNITIAAHPIAAAVTEIMTVGQ